MTEQDHPLDGELRGRLLDLVERAEPVEGISEARREAALSATLSRLAAAGRVRRLVFPAALTLAAAAALAFIATSPHGEGPSQAASSPAEPPTCPLTASVEQARFVDRGGASRELLLGKAAQVFAHDAELSAQALSPCGIDLLLSRGRVSVHARALQGGSLRVRAGLVDVVVHGTVFSVERTAAFVSVMLAEGRVQLERRDAPTLSLSPGERVRLSVEGELRREPMSPQQLAALLGEHGLPSEQPASASVEAEEPTEQAPEPQGDARDGGGRAALERAPAEGSASADQLLSRADDERKRGRLQRARELYRRASARSGLAAEAAFMRLSQLELQAGRPGDARKALAEYERRFAAGALRAEAAWLRVRIAQRQGDRAATLRAARELVAAHPGAPQAEAARRLLESDER